MMGSEVKRTRGKRGGKTTRGDFERLEQAIPKKKLTRHDTRTTECKNHTHTQKTMKNS